MILKEFNNVPILVNKYNQFDYIFPLVKEKGSILEFGVYKGYTINYISKYFKNDTIYGFDSFKGLPESWEFSDKIIRNCDRFKLEKFPNINKNVELFNGWFKDTIPIWKNKHRNDIKLLHIDCDIYSSTKTVLDQLNNYIVKDTIIVFDELLEGPDYQYWYKHEWQALNEWCYEKNRKCIPISKTEKYQAAIRVII